MPSCQGYAFSRPALFVADSLRSPTDRPAPLDLRVPCSAALLFFARSCSPPPSPCARTRALDARSCAREGERELGKPLVSSLGK